MSHKKILKDIEEKKKEETKLNEPKTISIEVIRKQITDLLNLRKEKIEERDNLYKQVGMLEKQIIEISAQIRYATKLTRKDPPKKKPPKK